MSRSEHNSEAMAMREVSKIELNYSPITVLADYERFPWIWERDSRQFSQLRSTRIYQTPAEAMKRIDDQVAMGMEHVIRELDL
jgi:hypothetical protein